MRCPSCNHENPADASFCEGCGAKLELICPACKASVSPGARFCKKCGTAIGPTKAAASATVSSPKSQILVAADGAASEAIDGERKTVTALFADIKGSTELMEDLDPEEAHSIVDPRAQAHDRRGQSLRRLRRDRDGSAGAPVQTN
jgi:ribosomal protein L40E